MLENEKNKLQREIDDLKERVKLMEQIVELKDKVDELESKLKNPYKIYPIYPSPVYPWPQPSYPERDPWVITWASTGTEVI